MGKILHYVKHLIYGIQFAIPMAKLFPVYFRASFRNKMLHLKEADKQIFFTLDNKTLFRDDDNSGREAWHVLKSFSDGGYTIYFYRPNNFRNYWSLRTFGRLIYNIKNLKFISKVPEDTKNYIYAFDTIRPDFLNLDWKKLIYINIRDSSSCYVGNVIPIPYFMMPYIYACGEDKKLEQYRNLTRKCRIFFAGNMSAVYYDSPFFKKRYPHLMTRLEGVKTINDSDLNAWLIKKAEDFKEFIGRDQYLNRLVMVDTGTSRFPIEPKNWLNILGQNDFFMCFSGTDYPMCHNAIEAMAVGSIPIIAYGDWFEPPLEHGKNAIIYTDKKDLIDKIKIALQMSTEEIKNLRKGVIDYYDNYLSSGYPIRKYEECARPVSTLMLLPKSVWDEKQELESQNFIQRFKTLNIQERVFNEKL